MSKKLSYSYLLKKSGPIIIANAAVPLLGLTDTAVMGNTGNVTDLGAINIGALIFSFVYWGFGFLRMSTSGFSAQAKGLNDDAEVRAILGRSLLLSVFLGVFLILCQKLIGMSAFSLLSASAEVEASASEYYAIRIWGAPATLSLYALTGILVGLGLSKQLLIVQLILNGLNIILDVAFAGYLNWGVEGIAVGTLVAECITAIFAFIFISRILDKKRNRGECFWLWEEILNTSKLKSMMSANFDIMVRTLLLVFSFAWFTNQSAIYGDRFLAANHILLQIISFGAFFLDGYAFVTESVAGSAYAAKQKELFRSSIYRSTVVSLLTSFLLAMITLFLGRYLINALTNIEEVGRAASGLLPYASCYILLSFAAFQLDAIFIGTSMTRQIRNAAIFSTSGFLLVYWILGQSFGVGGLWVSFIMYVCFRAIFLFIYLLPSLTKEGTWNVSFDHNIP